MAMSTDNKRIVQDAYDGMRGGDVQAFLGALDDEIVVHEPDCLPYGGVTRGLREFLAVLPKAGAVLDASKLEVEELVADGDSVVAIIRIGVRGGPDDVRLAEHWRLCDGKAVELRVFWFDPSLVPAAA